MDLLEFLINECEILYTEQMIKGRFGKPILTNIPYESVGTFTILLTIDELSLEPFMNKTWRYITLYRYEPLEAIPETIARVIIKPTTDEAEQMLENKEVYENMVIKPFDTRGMEFIKDVYHKLITYDELLNL